MADDLHTRLRTAIEAEKALAEAATPGPWEAAILSMRYDGIRGVQGDHVVVFAHHLEPAVADVEFVVTNDPARVLRRVARDLKVLERHDDHEGRCTECMEWCDCDRQTWVQDCPCRGNTPHPCPEIRDLADDVLGPGWETT